MLHYWVINKYKFFLLESLIQLVHFIQNAIEMPYLLGDFWV